MAYVLALDQGTTSSRAVIFDQRGGIVASAQQEIRQLYPRPGWVEHDPQEIFESQLITARLALARAGLHARDIAAIGIANQRETTLLWDRRTGEPVANAIVWQDRRTADACARLKEQGHEEFFHERSGLVLDAYFSGTKLMWLLDQSPAVRRRAERGDLAFGTVDSWLVWRLTGGSVHATDISNASRTLLFNLHDCAWDDELLARLRIPREVLPAVFPSAADFGLTEPQWLGAPIAIRGVAGDQQAALFGQACHRSGSAKNTYGTGCFLLLATGTELHFSRHGLLTTAAAQVSRTPTYALEGSVFIGGAVVQWLRDGLACIQRADEVEALAASVPDAGGVYFVPAFVGLGAPYWDPFARGGILGLSRGSTVAHIARAALEAIAFQSADVLLAMQAEGGVPLSQLRVDGGATANNLLMQIQADLLGMPVIRPKVLETTALGAAFLAGLGAGVWASLEEVEALWAVDRVFEPTLQRGEAEERLARWRRAVQRVRGWEGQTAPAG
jgi:glycerol kinase